MSEDRGSLGTNLLLFLVGAAAGAVLVALTTPKSGPDLRADLKEKAARIKRKAEEFGKSLRAGCGPEQDLDEEHEDEEVGI